MTSRSQATQAGFTLIELIVVIVILGILAATALPKLSNLSADAQRAKLKAAYAALNAEVALIHGKVMANSSSYDAANESVTVEGVVVGLTSGTSYPAATTALANAAGLTSADYSLTVNSASHFMVISPKGVADPSKCRIVYNEALDVVIGPAPADAVLTDADCS